MDMDFARCGCGHAPNILPDGIECSNEECPDRPRITGKIPLHVWMMWNEIFRKQEIIFEPGFEGRYCGMKSKVISFDGNRVTIAVEGYEASNTVPADVWRRENGGEDT